MDLKVGIAPVVAGAVSLLRPGVLARDDGADRCRSDGSPARCRLEPERVGGDDTEPTRLRACDDPSPPERRRRLPDACPAGCRVEGLERIDSRYFNVFSLIPINSLIYILLYRICLR